jgi:FkbM family methyltransferase
MQRGLALQMMQWLRHIVKWVIHHFPVALTKNERYDRLTTAIIKRVCHTNSVCIDAGAHTGKILLQLMKHAPKGRHWAFEPIPQLFHSLKRRYGSAVNVYPYALSNVHGTSSFNFVTTDMAYSGLRKRKYDKPEKDKQIQVRTEMLDHVIPATEKIALMKVDVEGAELLVLQGAINTIKRSKPVILFEFGKAGSLAYGYDDQVMFDFIDYNLYYEIFTLQAYKDNEPALSRQQLHEYYQNGKEYFFVAASK